MRGNEKRGSRKLPRFLFLASGDLPFGLLAVRRGLEPLTPCVTGTYSNQLNYRATFGGDNRTRTYDPLLVRQALRFVGLLLSFYKFE